MGGWIVSIRIQTDNRGYIFGWPGEDRGMTSVKCQQSAGHVMAVFDLRMFIQ